MSDEHRHQVESLGKLYLKVVEAKELLAMDICGTSDPYCKLKFGTIDTKTKTIYSTLTPVWQEEHVFTVTNNTEVLGLEVWDRDVGSKDDFIGYVAVKISELGEAQRDIWLPLGDRPGHEKEKKKNRGQVHLVMRYLKYSKLTPFLTAGNNSLAIALSKLAVKDQLARALVSVFVEMCRDNFVDLIRDIFTIEVTKTSTHPLTKACSYLLTVGICSCYLIVGAYWLPRVFGQLIRNICQKPDNVEVDPIKLTPGDNPQQNMAKLLEHARRFLSQMMEAFSSAPILLQQIVHVLAEVVAQKFPDQKLQAIGGYMFLRFLCPCISTPETFALADPANPPNTEARRQLILIAKIIQAVANNVKFGQKEPHLIPCNDYIDEVQPYFNKLLFDFSDGNTVTQPLSASPVSTSNLEEDLDYLIKFIVENSVQVQEAMEPSKFILLKAICDQFLPVIDLQKQAAAAAAKEKK